MNWYKRAISLSKDWRPNEKYMQIVKDVENRLKSELLPELKLFRSFSVIPVMDLSGRPSKYQKGTFSFPIILLDIDRCIGISNEDNTSIETVIEMQVLYRLGEAIQDRIGANFDTGWIKNFANMWYRGHGLVSMHGIVY